MPRRQFLADLKQSQQDPLPGGIHDLRAGDDDGQFEFLYRSPSEDSSAVQITALIPELSDYPSSHEYLIFCADDAPQHLAKQIQDLRKTERTTIAQLLELVSNKLSISTGSTAIDNADSQTFSQPELMDYDEEDDDDEDDFFGDSFNRPQHTVSRSTGDVKEAPVTMQNTTWQFRNRIRSDLRAVKDAGFHVDVLGDLLQGGRAYITIAIRTSKLGISEEAIQAWQLNPQDYIILLIHYPNGYKTNEQLQGLENVRLRLNYSVRIFCSDTPKSTLQEAIQAFTKATKEYNGEHSQSKQMKSSSLKEIFISRPLIGLLDERLPAVLKGRSAGMEWSGAESWYQDLVDASTDAELAIPDKYFEPEKHIPSLPDIVNADQYANRDLPYHSFPLLAMQFMLRHMVRCVEFCLVCHRKIDSEIEAIKPYVCSRPLCLFQYMNMGFGPSIEHEILSQPWVVDLLVSFCYSSAASNKLKDLPTGLGMRVPGAPSPANALKQPVNRTHNGYMQDHHQTIASEFTQSDEYEIGFDADNREIIFHNKPADGCPVGRGSWIVIQNGTGVDGLAKELHCRVVETSFYPTIRVSEPVVVRDTVLALPPSVIKKVPTPAPATPVASPRYTPAVFRVYDQDFDSLSHMQKCQTICRLLDLLPSIREMQEYLEKSRTSDLTKWVDRIPLATLSLLRWIIASNRACIMQVDGATGSSSSSYASKEERLYGMQGYIQFRFAMGAPDKEERFLSAVRKTKQRLKLKYPTIFAWHGSPLHNWHMIIREGLHFKNADHGRAYGHGVYHAVDANTSVGYSHMSGVKWPGSILRVSSAIALNELVNAPAEYVSNAPYYVVSQLDWIQTRYLLVKCDPTDLNLKAGEEKEPEVVHEQDPSRTPRGINGSIVIPASAMRSSHSKIGNTSSKNTVTKKLKNLFGDAVAVSSGTDSETEEGDYETFFVDEQSPDTSANSQVLPYVSGRASKKGEKKLGDNDFVPGSLDWSTLPLMPMPTYANPGTTKRLMSELKSVNKTMAETPQEELGWYIDVGKIDNVYQWIVELHSFHNFMSKGKPIPLAKDMQDAKIKSIVLEVRFGSDFPFSPPYIRVVRPRFLTFAQGGGGHVVMGGAMCMELLTNTGWSSISSIESVLMQVRLAIASEPFARLENNNRSDYGNAEAADGFIRACRTHGWKEPPGFKELSYGLNGGF